MQTCLYAIGVDLDFSYKKPLPRGSRKKLSAAVQRACTPHALYYQACNPYLQRFHALARTQSPRVYSLKIVYLETLHQGQRPARRAHAGVLLCPWARLRFACVAMV